MRLYRVSCVVLASNSRIISSRLPRVRAASTSAVRHSFDKVVVHISSRGRKTQRNVSAYTLPRGHWIVHQHPTCLFGETASRRKQCICKTTPRFVHFKSSLLSAPTYPTCLVGETAIRRKQIRLRPFAHTSSFSFRFFEIMWFEFRANAALVNEVLLLLGCLCSGADMLPY